MAYLVVARMTWEERWERMDPMKVLERKQQRATKQSREDRAREELEKLFKEKRDDVQG